MPALLMGEKVMVTVTIMETTLLKSRPTTREPTPMNRNRPWLCLWSHNQALVETWRYLVAVHAGAALQQRPL
jgi:hypothetical protein